MAGELLAALQAAAEIARLTEQLIAKTSALVDSLTAHAAALKEAPEPGPTDNTTKPKGDS